jgi:Ca-activated chloride channel family protein
MKKTIVFGGIIALFCCVVLVLSNGCAKKLSSPVGHVAQSAAEPWETTGLNDEVWIIERLVDGTVKPGKDDPGQGELRAQVPDGEIPLPLEHTDVRAKVSGFISSVNVVQRYSNPYDTKIEAVYVFPLPENSAVTDFVMTIGERHIRGLIREREEAEKLYREAKRQGLRASLLTQERPNIFTQKVANLEPGNKIEVKISYFNPLPYIDGEYEFVFPMVVGPRFNPPGYTDGIGAVGSGSRGISGQKTEIQYLKHDERSGHEISLSVDFDAGIKIEKVYSRSHSINVDRISDSRAVVSLQKNDTVPDKDFVLRCRVAGNRIKTAMLVDNGETGNTFAVLIQPPDKLSNVPRMPREMVFVLDCSGSMSGAPIAKVKQVVKHAIMKLDENDTFQVIRFSDSATLLSSKPMPATEENVQKALRYIDRLDDGGGTMMTEGIKAALDFPHDEDRLRVVSFMTDGYIGNEDEILAMIEKKLGSSRIFSFGVGTSVNRYLMDRMAAFGRGAVAYVGLDESAGEKVDQFYERIAYPALTDVEIDWDGMKVSDVYPRRIPDVFVGRPVMVMGKFQGSGDQSIRISGRAGTARQSYSLDVALDGKDSKHPAITSMWARWKIKDLSSMEISNRSPELMNEIIKTSIDYNLLCRYTAFIAVDTSDKTSGDYGITVKIPVPVPDGVRYETTVQDR